MAATRAERSVRFVASILAGCLVIVAGAVAAFALGSVTGHARFERIKGVPSAGYNEGHGIYESGLFLTPRDLPYVGPSRCLGAPPGQLPTSDGFYSIDYPAGTYSILVDRPDVFIRPKVVGDVVIQEGQTTIVNPELAIDYSTYTTDDWTDPWDSVWYQTFTATGQSITGASVRLAGTNATAGVIQILEQPENGDPDVRNWTLVAERAANTFKSGTGGNDNWTRWRFWYPGAPAGETVPTVPGRVCAMKVTGTEGVEHTFAPFKRNKDSSSYANGRAYNSAGVAQDFDLSFVVLSDNDGQRMTMNVRAMNPGSPGALVPGNFGTRWGQTFVAHGYALAAVDVFAAGDPSWNLDFTWRVREDGPTGAEIAPAKTTKAASYVSNTGLHGVSYCSDEVPLTPGRTCFVEFNNASGFNPYLMDRDSLAEGIARTDNTARPSVDLSMTIVEYTYVGVPRICVSPATLTPAARQGQNPDNGSFAVRNCGTGALYYTITTASYLQVVPNAGVLSAGETQTHTVQYDRVSFAPGSYMTSILVRDPSATNSPQSIPVNLAVTPFAADFDADGDVDLTDFIAFQACLNGPNRPRAANCATDADLDGDNDADLADFSEFQACFNGPNRPPRCP